MIQLIIKMNKKEVFKMNLYEELGKLDKITKNNIAQIKNHTATSLGRTISVLDKLTFNVGDIIVLDRAESWTEGGEFTCENEGILYFFSAIRLTMIF